MARRKSTPLERSIRAAQEQAQAKAASWRTDYASDLPAPNLARDPAKMSGSARRAYLKQLNKFNATEFLPNSSGKPLSPNAINAYKQAEQRYNDYARAKILKYGDVKLPGYGTIYERAMRLDQSGFHQLKNISPKHAPGRYITRRRDPQGFRSDEAAYKMAKQLEDKSKDKDLAVVFGKRMDTVRELLAPIGDERLVNKVNQLSRTQKDVLFNLTPFMAVIAEIYHGDDMNNHHMREAGLAEAHGIVNAIRDQVPRKG